MKTNKRILSVILTLALAFSLFVVAPMGAHAGEGSIVIASGEMAGGNEGLPDSGATQGGQSASGQDGEEGDTPSVIASGDEATEEEGLGDSEAIQGQPNPPDQDSGDLAALGEGELTPLGEGDLSALGEGELSALATYVCQIGSTKYETLDAALTAVNAMTDGSSVTITLLANILHKSIVVIDNKKVNFDLNGKKLDIVVETTGGLRVRNDGEVRLVDQENGELNVTGVYGVWIENGGCYVMVTSATATNGKGVNAQGSSGVESTLVVYGDVRAANEQAVSVSGGGKLVVAGNAITSGTATQCAYAIGNLSSINVGGHIAYIGSDSPWGALVTGNSTITVNGGIVGPDPDNKYVSVNGVMKKKSQGVTVVGNPGYLQYKDGTNPGAVWVSDMNLSNLSVEIPDQVWTGKKIMPTTFLHNGVSYNIVAHTTVLYSGSNKNIGEGIIVLVGNGSFTGNGMFTGGQTISFNIVPKSNKVSSIAVGTKQMKVTWTKVSAAQKVTKYVVSYREKGTSIWTWKEFSATKSSGTIKGLTKGKKYDVQVRSYKTISGINHYSAWSPTKTSAAIK